MRSARQARGIGTGRSEPASPSPEVRPSGGDDGQAIAGQHDGEQRIVDHGQNLQAQRCADRGDLKRFIRRSRCRKG